MQSDPDLDEASNCMKLIIISSHATTKETQHAAVAIKLFITTPPATQNRFAN